MISAKEALDLYETSDAAVKQHLDDVEAAIRNAAKAGKRETLILGKKLIETAPAEQAEVSPSPLQAKVIAEVKKAKFRAELVRHGEPAAAKGAEEGAGLMQAWVIKVSF